MITAQNFYCAGTLSSTKPISITTLLTNSASNVSFGSPLVVSGNITTTGALTVGETMYITYRLTKDIQMNTNEYSCINNTFAIDSALSDITAITTPNEYVYDMTSGLFTVPMSGLYNIDIQGSFANTVPEAVNGVYFYFQSESYPAGRIAPIINSSKIVSTSRLAYLKQGEIVKSIFYSSDPNSTLIGSAGETFVGFTIIQITA